MLPGRMAPHTRATLDSIRTCSYQAKDRIMRCPSMLKEISLLTQAEISLEIGIRKVLGASEARITLRNSIYFTNCFISHYCQSSTWC